MFLREGIDHARLQAILREAARGAGDQPFILGQLRIEREGVFPIEPNHSCHVASSLRVILQPAIDRIKNRICHVQSRYGMNDARRRPVGGVPAIAETRHFVRAADRLGIAQSVVSSACSGWKTGWARGWSRGAAARTWR
jgi:hypothetical protein